MSTASVSLIFAKSFLLLEIVILQICYLLQLLQKYKAVLRNTFLP